jgi:hypothetical protein
VKFHEIQSSPSGGSSDSSTLAQSFAEATKFDIASIVLEPTALQGLDGKPNPGVATTNGALRTLHVSHTFMPHLKENTEPSLRAVCEGQRSSPPLIRFEQPSADSKSINHKGDSENTPQENRISRQEQCPHG